MKAFLGAAALAVAVTFGAGQAGAVPVPVGWEKIADFNPCTYGCASPYTIYSMRIGIPESKRAGAEKFWLELTYWAADMAFIGDDEVYGLWHFDASRDLLLSDFQFVEAGAWINNFVQLEEPWYFMDISFNHISTKDSDIEVFALYAPPPVAQIPLPASAALIPLGLAALAAVKRRR